MRRVGECRDCARSETPKPLVKCNHSYLCQNSKRANQLGSSGLGEVVDVDLTEGLGAQVLELDAVWPRA